MTRIRSVKYEAVEATYLVDHRNGDLIGAGDCCQHFATQVALPHPEGRRRNIEKEVSAIADESFNGIEPVETLVPKVFVVPRVFANG